MNVFEAAQPALLYIVPTVLGSTALHAVSRGEIMKVQYIWNLVVLPKNMTNAPLFQVFKFEEDAPPEDENTDPQASDATAKDKNQ